MVTPKQHQLTNVILRTKCRLPFLGRLGAAKFRFERKKADDMSYAHSFGKFMLAWRNGSLLKSIK
jgi:hypothetical protein